MVRLTKQQQKEIVQFQAMIVVQRLKLDAEIVETDVIKYVDLSKQFINVDLKSEGDEMFGKINKENKQIIEGLTNSGRAAAVKRKVKSVEGFVVALKQVRFVGQVLWDENHDFGLKQAF